MFTSRRDQKYASFNFDQSVSRFNREYLIYFENEAAERMFNSLLLHPCRVCQTRARRDPGGGTVLSSPSSSSLSSNTVEFKNLKDLDAHLRREHELFLCDLCTENLKVFSKERKYYSRKDLVRHRKTGDPEDTSHRGHPLCKFCDVRYMDDEDLHRHLRKDHYYCHFCDPLGLHQFYDSYGNLRDHFRKEHFLCEDGSCREEKFTSVFRSEIDMQAHRAVNHCNTRMEAKEARILSLDFSLKPRPAGGLAPQISATIQHQTALSSRIRNSGQSSGLLGAVGGQDMIESDDTELLLPQELPRPEDFPTLAADAAGSTKDSNASGNREQSSYSELAEKGKDFTQKVPQGIEKKNRKGQPATFSSRIGGGGLSGRLDEDFPVLASSGLSGMMLCPPVPVGSSLASKKELKNASKYATLSSVAAAVTSGVPKVVSKVATATCLPSGSSSLSGPGIMSCSANNSKTLSTQSLLSSSSSVAPTSSGPQVKDFSVKSSTDFPSLPVIESKKKAAGSKALSSKVGNTNPAFSGSSESFGPSTSKSTTAKKVDFATKVASAPLSVTKKKNSSQVKSGLQSLGSLNNTTCKTTSESGESSRTRLKVETTATVSNSSGNTSTGNKSVQLKNENEFPGLEPSLPASNRLSSSNSTVKNKENNRTVQATSSATSKNPSTSMKAGKPTSNKSTSGSVTSGSNTAKTVKKSGNVSSNNTPVSGQTGKKAPPPPPALTSMSNGHHSKSSKDTSSSSCSAGSITLSSVAQVIMGSCGPGSGSSSSAQNKASSSSDSRRHHQNNRTLTTDENGNSCNSGSEITSQDQEENLVNLEEPSSGNTTSGYDNNRKDNDFNHRLMSGGVNDRSSDRREPRSTAVSTSVTTSPETFVPPTNFEERNLSLVKEVSDILQDPSKFSAFKKVSNDFRRGETRGDEYYKKCIELFGRNNFGKIFSELITLLPNVKKQNELLSAHERSLKVSQGAVPKTTHHRNDVASSTTGVWIINNSSFTEQGLLVCPTCQQVLAKRDGHEHMLLHQRQH